MLLIQYIQRLIPFSLGLGIKWIVIAKCCDSHRDREQDNRVEKDRNHNKRIP